MINCKLCKKELRTLKSLVIHLRYNHSDYTTKRYYDEFLKKDGEGVCKLEECNNKTIFYRIGKGYLDHCCKSHAQKNPDIRKRLEDTKEKRYGNKNFTNRDKAKKTTKQRYGYEFYNNREQCSEKLLNRTEEQKEEWRQKIRKIMVERGEWLPDEELSTYKLYRREVDYHTRKNLKYFDKDDIINRSKRGLSIDHIFSVKNGFILNVKPEIVGHFKNLRLISMRENSSKHDSSDITLYELLTLIKEEQQII